MERIPRRGALALFTAGVALTASGCARSSTRGGVAHGDAGSLQWWDHFDPLKSALTGLFDEFEGNAGVAVERTVYNPDSMGQALQLAEGSDQLPDVFTNLFGAPSASLVDRGTVAPVELSDEAHRGLEGSLFEGVHTFDGKTFTVPIFSHRQNSTLTWANSSLLEKADHEPEDLPSTWDEFRTLCRDLVASGTEHPWVAPLAHSDRMQEHLVDLAQSAGQTLAMVGSSGNGITDARTGDFPFASEAFLEAFTFLHSLITDGFMLPASTSLDAREARVRWASGEAAIFFDGPWNAGVLNGQFGEFMKGVRVSGPPSPDGRGLTARPPADGQFWCAGTSHRREEVGELFSLLTRPEFAVALAENMDQPPADPHALGRAEVPALYSRAVRLLEKNVRTAPSPVVRNPAVGSVIAEMNDIRPDLGDITQGYLGGDIDDLGKELTRFNDRLSTERDRAIDVVNGAGGDVSVDDWIFEEYRSGDDFDVTDY